MNHNDSQFEYINFMRVLREQLEKAFIEYKLFLGTLDLTFKEVDDRLIAVPGTYYKVVGFVTHKDTKKQVRFEKEFLADILQKTDLDQILPIAFDICDDVVDHFFGIENEEPLELKAKDGSHGIKGLK